MTRATFHDNNGRLLTIGTVLVLTNLSGDPNGIQ
jgi:hypothetical protein